MIINHNLKLIHIKTYKTSGSTFEALLRWFDNHPLNVYTPMDPVHDQPYLDKHNLVHDKNYWPVAWPDGSERYLDPLRLYEHSSFLEIEFATPAWILRNYTKVAIVRNPWHQIVSQFWWDNPHRHSTDEFMDYVEQSAERKLLGANYRLRLDKAGNDRMDVLMQYENMSKGFQDLEGAVCADLGLAEKYLTVQLKNNQYRRSTSAFTDRVWTVEELYDANPRAYDLVYEYNRQDIETFGYHI